MRWAALALAALALTGCETSAQKSARLEREALSHARASPQRGVLIETPSKHIHVVSEQVLSSSEGAAVIVTLANDSSQALAAIPLALTVHDAHGAQVYANSAPGVARSLTSVPLVPAHGRLVWVDDQVQSSGGTPASASARVGEGTPARGALPAIAVVGANLGSGEAEGTVVNHSAVSQRELVVYALGVRAGRVVAAGRAVVASLAAGASAPFQVFFIGDPSGSRLSFKALPSTLP